MYPHELLAETPCTSSTSQQALVDSHLVSTAPFANMVFARSTHSNTLLTPVLHTHPLQDGVWAGYLECVAASHLLQCNLHIYQAGQPRWTIDNYPDSGRTLHLAYEDGQHYNSVRMAEDVGNGPPEPIVIRTDGVVASGESTVKVCG